MQFLPLGSLELGTEKNPDPKKNRFALRKDRSNLITEARNDRKTITSHASRRVESNFISAKKLQFAVSTPSIGLGKPPMFGKTRCVIAPGGRQLNPLGSSPDPEISLFLLPWLPTSN
jgi:hypothetical protein